MSLIAELKRRNVFRVGIGYIVIGWLLAQVAEFATENFGAPEWILKIFVVFLLLGFILAVFFAWAFELTPEGFKKEKDIERSQSITRQTGRKLDFVIITFLVLALGYFAYDKFVLVPARDAALVQATEIAEAEQAAARPVKKSIAVLPFVNMSDDAGNEYFSDGISEEILNALAKVKQLKVAGRTSSFAFKGTKQDLRQIGATLGVEHILEGSVRRAGTKIRITAQLIQVSDGFHLWSDTYDRELTDIFAIQDEIAAAILQQLKAALLDGEEALVTATRTNSQAYDHYLMAKQRIYQRTRPALEAAAELLDQAIAIDPDYAPAYAQRGIATLLLSDENYGTIPSEQAEAQAKLYVDQALRLDPQQPEALAGRGLYFSKQPGQVAKAIEALEQALAINPNLVNAANWLHIAYGDAGRNTEAMKVLEQMAERDPLYRPGIANLAGSYVAQRKLEQAEAIVERVRPFMPNDPFLFRIEANILYARGEIARGLRRAEEALALRPDNFQNQGLVGFGLMFTVQYERLAEVGHPWQRAIALFFLDRMEEATLLAQQLADSGDDVASLIGLLANTGRQEDMIRFFDDRWPSLDAFEADFPILGTGGIDTMTNIAYAYFSVGNQERFADAMNRVQAALETTRNMGFDYNYLAFLEGVYATLAGEHQAALTHLAAAVDRGFLMGARMSDGWSALKVLEGDPEYEAIQSRMVEHLNAERAELGLEPVTI